MKEELKEILYMGLGAVSLTGEKASQLKKELLEKGEKLYNEGAIKNEELKRNLKEKIKENTNIKYNELSKEDLVDIIKDLDEKDKKEILDELAKKEEDKEKETTDENKEESKSFEIKIEDGDKKED